MGNTTQKTSSKILLSVLTASIVLSPLGGLIDATPDGASSVNQKELALSALKKAQQKNKVTSANQFKAAALAQIRATGKKVDKLAKSQTVRVLVTLDSVPAVSKSGISKPGNTNGINKAEDTVLKKQVTVQDLAENITNSKIKHAYGYLVNGFSIDATVTQVDELRKLPGVKSVDAAKVTKPQDESANQLANVQKVWENNKLKGEGTVIAIIDTGIDPTHKDMRLTDASTGKITKTEAEKQTKALGYGQYYSAKIPFGRNYADASNEIRDLSGEMHGMHVAGIAGANGENASPTNLAAVRGVAPEAQLLAMKVFSNNENNPYTFSDDQVAAIQDSVKLGADVINMSLGSSSGSADLNDPTIIAIQAAAKAGVISVISAGNSGTSAEVNSSDDPADQLNAGDDLSIVGAPSTAPDAISVASSQNTMEYGTAVQGTIYDGDDKETKLTFPSDTTGDGALAYQYISPINGKAYDNFTNKTEYVDGGTGALNDFTGKNVKGKIAVIKRGELAFADKVANAKSAGAVGVILYDNVDEDKLSPALSDTEMPVLMLNKADGEYLVGLVAKGKLSLKLNYTSVPNEAANNISNFSSIGPGADFNFKPEISAPGERLWSTANNNGYQEMSGTSMAAPFTSGSEALIAESVKQKGLKLSGLDLVQYAKQTLMNTADPIQDPKFDKGIISPRRQGAGQLQVDKAINNNVALTNVKDGKPDVNLKSFDTLTKELTVQLKNTGTKNVQYRFNDFGGIYTQAKDKKGSIYDTQVKGSSVVPESGTVSVKPGETKAFKVKLQLPVGFTQNFVEGYLQFKGISSATPTLTIPYLGYYGNYDAISGFDVPVDNDKNVSGYGYLTSSTNEVLGVDRAQTTYLSSKAAISPNGDAVKDDATGIIALLRNLKNVAVNILNAQGKSVKQVYQTAAAEKNYIPNQTADPTLRPTVLGTWDGTQYDQKSGDNKIVADGKYTYEVTGKPLTGDKQQKYDLPVTVDTQAPELQLDKVSDVKLSFQVKDFLADDTTKGIGEDISAVAVVVNGTANVYDLTTQKDANELDVALNENQVLQAGKNKVTVALTDFAGNIGYAEKTVTNGETSSLVLDNGLVNGQAVTLKTPDYDAKTQTLKITGNYKTNFYLNGQVVNVDNQGNFEIDVPVVNGELNLVFSSDKSQQKILKNLALHANIDAPKLALTNPTSGSATVWDTTDYELKGTTDADTTQLYFFDPAKGLVEITKDIDANGNFTLPVSLANGQNVYILLAFNGDQNETDVSATITRNSTTSAKYSDYVTFGDSFSPAQQDQVYVSGTDSHYNAKTNEYTLTGQLTRKFANFTVAGKQVTVDPTTLKFNVTFKLQGLTGAQGKIAVPFYLQDDDVHDGKPVMNQTVNFFVDSLFPTLNLDGLTFDKNGNFELYTNKNVLDLKGEVNDNLEGYQLKINNSSYLTDSVYGYFNNAFYADREAAKFNYKIDLTDGKNIVKLDLSDMSGNQTSRTLTVNYKLVNLKAPTAKDLKLPDTTNAKKISTLKLAPTVPTGATLEYSLDNGKTWGTYAASFQVTKNQNVLFRVTDKYGNISPVTTYKVSNIVKVKTKATALSIAQAYTLNKYVSGKTTKKTVVKVTDTHGKLLGKATANAKGAFKVKLKKVKKNQKVYVLVDAADTKTQINTLTKKVVKFKVSPKPKANSVKAKAKKVTGKTTKGVTIKVYNNKSKLIGKKHVTAKSGKFTIKVNKKLKKGVKVKLVIHNDRTHGYGQKTVTVKAK